MTDDRAVAFIRKLLDVGIWYISAIELRGAGTAGTDGEELEQEARAIVAAHQGTPDPTVARDVEKRLANLEAYIFGKHVQSPISYVVHTLTPSPEQPE